MFPITLLTNAPVNVTLPPAVIPRCWVESISNTPPLAELLIRELVGDLDAQILLDCSNLNPYANYLLSSLGFEEISKTYRMYKGIQPPCPMNQVYGLACLELG